MARENAGGALDVLVVEASGFKVGLLMNEILELLPTEKLQGVKVLDLRHHFDRSVKKNKKKLASVLLRKTQEIGEVQLLVDQLGDIHSISPDAIETFPPGVAREIPFWAVARPRTGREEMVPLIDVPRLLAAANEEGLVS